MHDFNESLARSHAASDLPIWEQIYRRAFPDFQVRIDHRQDGEHQRAGIDASVVLKNSKQLLIDEKVRFKNYGDIALEYWSKESQKIPGWVCKPSRADFICYAIAPAGVAYLLPMVQLQQVWRSNGGDWIKRFKKIDSANNGYVTVSCGVPVKTLFAALCNTLRVQFEPFGVVAE